MKRFFAKHAKSSALLLTLSIHAALLIVATGFVAFKILVEPPVEFRPAQFDRKRPNVPLKLKPPKTRTPKAPKPRLQEPKRITAIKPTNVILPRMAMIGVPMLGNTDGANEGLSIGFDTEFNFFDSQAKGEKVCFIVHFGPATIGKTPYSRMTGYTIRKRLEDIVGQLPDYALFNVACYWAGDTCAMAPQMMLANPANKEKVLDWMEPVNPLEGNYSHCFAWNDAESRVRSARNQWPTRVEPLPGYSTKWAYPYVVPEPLEKKYLGNKGFTHWGRAVAWSILTQQPDTIFVLTTNYIDGWGGGGKGEPAKMVAGYKKMMLDAYGPDKKRWPTINVVVLAHAGKDSTGAHNVLDSQFGPIVRAFHGDGSVIEDISKFMNDAEKKLLRQYASEHGE
ncbi:hypothetical protein PDESU_02346 [Pontiella desulfatans]|uniref:Runt domain-containing protein n=1 Tax=Pontiella desulfatans TaxID=2750659 RepID=A0A6C2U1W2_PONDE|nr:hypothetical protein [Pontiella desulfatans]VGO13789.1 hypothetical protein PDESU_02346 [Pontiella desulfatans]